MGNAGLQLYARRKDNEKYVYLGKSNIKDFKHHVIAFSMDQKHTDMKSLYLYNSYYRVAKAHVSTKYRDYLTTTNFHAVGRRRRQISDIPWLFKNSSKSTNQCTLRTVACVSFK